MSLNVNVNSSIIHDRQKVETSQCPFTQMSRQTKCDLYVHWILSSGKKEILTYDETWNIILSEINQSQKDRYFKISLYEALERANSEIESRMVLLGAGETA